LNTGHQKLTNRAFFQNEDVIQLSNYLLGKFVVTHIDGIKSAGKIVEVEAYGGIADKACHAFQNRRTKRTETMFGDAAHAYVYLCYGIHHLFNVVTAPKNTPHAVLIRGIEPADNIDTMLKRRKMERLQSRLSAGPGVLSQALGITTELNGVDLMADETPIWLEDRGERIKNDQIIASPRIGVDYAGQCAHWPWRFYLKDNPWVSRSKQKLTSK
jgi:DNA-3-methyladenine glycosylase